MPGMDGTGPVGLGPLTGRCMGYTSRNTMLGCGRRFRRNCLGIISMNSESLIHVEEQLEKRLSEVRSQIEKLK